MLDSHTAFRARLTPRAVAIHRPAGPLSFATLDADVDRLAFALSATALEPGHVVAIDVDDGVLQLVLALLARMGIASAVSTDPGADERMNLGRRKILPT